MAVAEQISVDVALLSELDDIFTQKSFFEVNNVFSL